MTRIGFCTKDFFHIGLLLELSCTCEGCLHLVYVCERDNRRLNFKHICRTS